MKRDISCSCPYARVSWYNTDHWLMNGFLLPSTAHSALGDLVRLGRFPSLDAAVSEDIRILLEENAPLLIRNDHRWMRLLTWTESSRIPLNPTGLEKRTYAS